MLKKGGKENGRNLGWDRKRGGKLEEIDGKVKEVDAGREYKRSEEYRKGMR